MIVPIPNPFGFALNLSKELVVKEGKAIGFKDVYRDFPYDTTELACLNTVSGKSIYRLITDNLFVTGLSFHTGRDEPLITYPWGSKNVHEPVG